MGINPLLRRYFNSSLINRNQTDHVVVGLNRDRQSLPAGMTSQIGAALMTGQESSLLGLTSAGASLTPIIK